MKKTQLFLCGAFLFCSSFGFSQVNVDLKQSDFNTLLNDASIQLNWNEVNSLNFKEKIREEDKTAVYSKYLQSLQNSNLIDDAMASPVLRQEIEAVKSILNSKN